METTVSEDAKVLGCGDSESGFVEWAEFDGVAVKWYLEDWHGGGRRRETVIGLRILFRRSLETWIDRKSVV